MRKNRIIFIATTLLCVCSPFTSVWGQNEQIALEMNRALVEVAKRTISFYLSQNNNSKLAVEIDSAISLEGIVYNISKKTQTMDFYKSHFPDPDEAPNYFRGNVKDDLKNLESTIYDVIYDLRNETISVGPKNSVGKPFESGKIDELNKEFESIYKVVKEKVMAPPVVTSSKNENSGQLEKNNDRAASRERPTNVPANNNIKWIIIGFFVAVAVILFLYKKNSRSKESNKTTPEPSINYKEKYENEFFRWQQEVKELKLELEAKERILTSLTEKYERTKADLEKFSIKTSVEQPPVIFSNPTPVTFYMSTPNEDGSFSDNMRQAVFAPTSSLYKFEVIGPGKAKFEFIPDDRNIKDAKYQAETLLEPVCEIENKTLKDIQFIDSREPGFAELIGDRWKVDPDKKNRIRFR